jgi:arylsulfatase A-like enzyme
LNYQGISLTPFVDKGNIRSERKEILIEHLWTKKEIPSSEGIRTDRWKYFRYRFIDAPEELYDLQNDPLEKKNLAKDPKYASVISSLRKSCGTLTMKYQGEKLCPDDPFLKDSKF